MLGPHDLFLRLNDPAQILRLQIGILAAFCVRFEAIHDALELFMRHPDHDFAEQ